MLRIAIAFGINPIDAFRAATLNPAEYFRLNDRGDCIYYSRPP